MDYEKFIADFDDGKELDQTLYDFACLKIARHSLINIISKNNFEAEVEDELEHVLKLLNQIHANNSQIEREFEK